MSVAAFEHTVRLTVQVSGCRGGIAEGVKHHHQIAPTVVVIFTAQTLSDDAGVVLFYIVGMATHVDRGGCKRQPIDAVNAVDICGKPSGEGTLATPHHAERDLREILGEICARDIEPILLDGGALSVEEG